MNRKDFLKILWYKGIKPITIIGALIFSIVFLIRIFTKDGTERFIAIIILGFVILVSISYLINLVVLSIKSKIPKKILQKLKIIDTYVDSLIPFVYGILTYYFFHENMMFGASFFLALAIIKIIELVGNKKLKKRN